MIGYAASVIWYIVMYSRYSMAFTLFVKVLQKENNDNFPKL